MSKTRIVLAWGVVLAWFCVAQGADSVVAAGPWEMERSRAPGKWMPAVVPGTVLATLVKNGIVPDPYQGLNNKIEQGLIPDLSQDRTFYEATFRTKVILPKAWTNRVVWMRPEGINYRSEIYLNGKLATSTRGMFARNPVNVSTFVATGRENDLVVKVWPVDHPGTTQQKKWGAAGEWHNGGDGEIGRDVTMLMSAGWDFTFSDGIRDRNAGIWKDIVFFVTDGVRLDHPFVRTELNDDFSEAELTLEVDLQNAGNGSKGGVSGVLEAKVSGADIVFRKEVSLFRGERRTEFLSAKLLRPKLWWPRNKGDPNLYDLTVRFVNGTTGAVSDSKSIRFGVRELTSDQSGEGGARQFYVNRRKIFIRGTNWIPEAMLKADDARMEKEVRLTAESGVNLVRLWAGGIVESDRFYDLCDEYGLLVWQEFWMTGDTKHPDDPGLYLDCVAQQVKRIRHHASLAHWVASNESTEVAGTEELVKKLTGTTSWMMQSECDGVHDGSPYFPVNPMRYYEDTASTRGSRVYGFSPEYGTCALPAADQCRKFMPEELLWPMDVAAWKYREGGGFDQMTLFHHQAVNGYGESKTFDEYCRKSQAADALAHRALWETWNLARNTATGVLFWYNNTPIPQLGSHAWDYDLDQTASFFAQKNALEPLHAQYEYLSNRVSIASDVYGTHDLTVKAEVYDFDSQKVWEKEVKARIEGEGCAEVFTIPFADIRQSNNPNNQTIEQFPHFIKLRLSEQGKEIASTFYWRSASRYEGPETVTGPCVVGFEKLDELPRTMLAVERTADGVRVTNAGEKIAFMVNVQCVGPDGKRLVPVHYSENFFALLPGESQTVQIEGAPRAAVSVSAWNADALDCLPVSDVGFSFTTDHDDALYACGEDAVFTVTATNGIGAAVKGGFVSLTLDNYGTNVLCQRTIDLSKENPFVVKGALHEPGFLRLTMSGDAVGEKSLSRWSVGYEPTKIRPAGTAAEDFDAFWKSAQERLEATVPLDPQLVHVPERSQGAFDFWRVSFATLNGQRVWGFLSVPKDKSKAPFPVSFEVPSAGTGAWAIDMQGEPNRIRMYMTVHPFDPPRTVEENVARHKCLRAEVGGYYGAAGLDGKPEDWYFFPTVLGINRAVNWLWRRDDVDRTRFGYTGGSQGGFFGWMLCGLNSKFTSAVLRVPAGSDLRAPLVGRCSAWPYPLRHETSPEWRTAAIVRNLGYFDGASFAQRIKCPIRVSVGFIDNTCPPSAVYAVFNALGSKDKQISNCIGKGHFGQTAVADRLNAAWQRGL